MVTVFEEITNVLNPFFQNINEVLNSFKDGSNKSKIERIRSISEKEDRNKAKGKLRSVCFSGKFRKREQKSCIEHSGFCCLDFDNVENPIILRDSLQDNEYIYSAFVSPSGTGVKAIVRIPPEINNHKKYYEALCETFDSTVDIVTSNVASVCYESYDPDLFINEKSKIWSLKKEYTEVTRNNSYPKYFKIEDRSKKVDVILKWFNKKFTLNVGERNANLFKLASGLNRAGLEEIECINLFNSFYSSGLTEKEIVSIVKSAYKRTSEYNTLTLIDDNKIYEAQKLLKKGVKDTKKELIKEGLSEHEAEEVIEFDFETDFLIFWDLDKNGKVILNDFKFKLFLENRGFYKVQLNEREFTFVRVENNIIEEISEINIKDFVLKHVIDVDINVYNFFARSTTRFSETYLNQLETKELSMVRDNSIESFLFFKNKVVKITSESIEYIDYINIGGFIWKKNIIDFEFEFNKKKSDYEQFITNICNNNSNRVLILRTAIGYLLSTFKKQDEGVAIIFYDESLNDNPSGRTGKTLISDGIAEVRKLTTLNGKEFNNKGQFPYQTINLDDNVVCFDDMERTFKFESLFSIITGDLTLNKKNLQPIVIPFEKSPKIMFTSNYILSGDGDSHDARKIEIELFRHYSKTHKPIDEFGKLFFSKQWSKDDWNKFFSFMIGNIQLYLEKGLLASVLTTGKTKKVIANTCEDFFDFCENEFNWQDGHFYSTKEIFKSYKESGLETPNNMNVSWFGKWLNTYFEFKNWKREDTTYGGIRKFAITGIDNKI